GGGGRGKKASGGAVDAEWAEGGSARAGRREGGLGACFQSRRIRRQLRRAEGHQRRRDASYDSRRARRRCRARICRCQRAREQGGIKDTDGRSRNAGHLWRAVLHHWRRIVLGPGPPRSRARLGNTFLGRAAAQQCRTGRSALTPIGAKSIYRASIAARRKTECLVTTIVPCRCRRRAWSDR